MITVTLDPVLAGALLGLLLAGALLGLEAMVRARRLQRRLDTALARSEQRMLLALAQQRVMERCPHCAPYLGTPATPPRPD